MADQILPFVYMLGILLLALPTFLQSNYKLKKFLTNLTIWIVIILIILTYQSANQVSRGLDKV